MIQEHGSDMEQYAGWTAGSPDVKKLQEDRERALLAKGWEAIMEFADPKGPAQIPDRLKTYNKVNGVISVVDSQGKKYTKPFSPKVEALVRDAGFELDEKMGVAYANGFPDHPDARQRWQTLWDEHNTDARIAENEQTKN
jgi:hypothetical protein